ncbi:MAG: SDR family oxidoreductase [Blastocatellia bacterium]|nr:SDR family oxidoreductase [Blastocatellia bacterium]MBK6428380.1 SDR family oxidoreductase [Blastocatellia bacterium]
MELGLNGRTALVTGASRGIGRSIAEVLSREGMSLVLVARSEQLLSEVAASLPGPAFVIPADLRDSRVPALAIQTAVETFGRLDLLVNNAGDTKRGDFLELTDDDWDLGFSLKFRSAVRCARSAWPHLKATRGSIVNVIGIGGRTGSAEFTIGGAVNAALQNLTKALADRGVQDGVRVNAVNPSSIATDRLVNRVRRISDERGIEEAAAANEIAQKLRVSRFGEPDEVARVVAFLASDAAGYCNGSIVDVDGGQTRTL